MERDFLGLASKSAAAAATAITVKEETSEGSKDSASVKGSGMQLSFSNKASAIPQFLSFKTAPQEDRPRKIIHDPLVSSGIMSISTAETFDSNKKPYFGMVEKNMILDKHGGNHYAMTAYAMQNSDASRVHMAKEMRMFPIPTEPNQAIAVSMSTPLLHSQLTSAGQNVAVSTVNQQPLGGVSIVSPVSVHPLPSSVIGTTDLRNTSKSNGAPAQLTIFYNGSVCVYDDVSPQKAQAIMLLAGNGSSMTNNKMPPTAHLQASIPRPSVVNGYVASNSHINSPCSGLPTSISMTTYGASQSNGGPACINQLPILKSLGVLASSNNRPEPAKAISSVGSAATSLIPAVAVPQARKASLARFLEKRKERVMSTSPYTVNKKSSDCNSRGSDGLRFSVNSSGSCLLPAIN